jgi:hypothetical protein
VSRGSIGSESVRRRAILGLLVVSVVVLAALLPANALGVTAGDRYVALGDSYAAGPLIPPPNRDFPGCLKSLNNYPHLVAKDLNLQLKDATAAGPRPMT